MPPGAGASRVPAVLDGVGDDLGVGIRLCSDDEFSELDVLELALPEFDEASTPDDVPDEDDDDEPDDPALEVVLPAFLGTA